MQRVRTENWRLRWERQRRGWSQDDVVDQLQEAAANRGDPELGVDRNTVSRWERGISHPTPRYVRLLSEIFTLRPEDLGLILAPPPPSPPAPPPSAAPAPPSTVSPIPRQQPERAAAKLGDEVDRRTFLRHAAGVAGLAAIPAGLAASQPGAVQGEPWERLIHALRRPSPVDPTLVTDVEALTAGLHVLEGRVPARHLVSQVSVHLDRLAELLQGSATEALRQRLICTAGDAAVLGAWIAWDMGDRTGAFRLFETAITAAREGADPALRACILAYGSYGASADGDPQRARNLLEMAGRCVDGVGFPATFAWIACRQAEETAALGEASDALQLLDRGLASFTNADPEGERVWTRFLDTNRVRGFAISTYARVGDARSALRIAEEVLASLDPEHQKKRAIVLASSAEVHLQQGNVEEGIDLARDALTAALETETTWGFESLRRLPPLLRQWQDDPEVRQFDQRLAASLAAV
jgi:transcriptional regulator with XRE-family HTH domain/tetratricopeptide (TPR) repeat protein